MLKKLLNLLLKISLSCLAIILILKLISYIPANRIQSSLAKKLLFLQKQEQKLEDYFSNLYLTFKTVGLKREGEQKYRILYQEAKTKNILKKALIYDNQYLVEKLGFKRKFQYKLISGQIISRQSDSWFNFLMVNKGKESGIRKDMPVINEEGLIGHVDKVFPDSCQVVLLIDPRIQISCKIERTKEIGVLSGQLTKPMKLDYIDYNSDLQEGDLLLTSGYSMRYPRGIPVGLVSKITKRKNIYYKTVFVKPLVNFSKLDIVFFVK